MALDLTISGLTTARLRKTVEQLFAPYGCETWGTDALGVGLGQLTDDEVKKVYKALVRTAVKHGLRPRQGSDDGLRSPTGGVA